MEMETDSQRHVTKNGTAVTHILYTVVTACVSSPIGHVALLLSFEIIIIDSVYYLNEFAEF